MNNNIVQKGDYWVDEKNNQWEVKKYTKEEAEYESDSLINCHNCINCKNCQDCYNCINCEHCHNCVNCKGCTGCFQCETVVDSMFCLESKYCFNCLSCVNCIDCHYCTNSVGNTNCEYCSHSCNLYKEQLLSNVFNNKRNYNINKHMRKESVETVQKEKYSLDKHIDNLAMTLHLNAKNNGWWDDILQDTELKINKDKFLHKILIQLLNAHTELSEATEEIKNKKTIFYTVDNKPEGLLIEIVDCIIRCLDMAQMIIDVDIDDSLKENNIFNISDAIIRKAEYNKIRGYKHGNDVAGGKFV